MCFETMHTEHRREHFIIYEHAILWTVCLKQYVNMNSSAFQSIALDLWGVLQWLSVSPRRPNVCVEREVMLVAQRQPCIQAFTRMVKVWKQGCAGQSRCLGYERRWVLECAPYLLTHLLTSLTYESLITHSLTLYNLTYSDTFQERTC